MNIRLTKKEDIPICGEIYADAFAGLPYNEKWNSKESAEMLAELYKKSPESCWCAVDGEKILGFAFCIVFGKFRAIVQELAVSPKYQSKGIGTGLMEKALDDFKKRGVQTVELVVNRNAPAMKLYEKMQFRQPKEYLLMVKSLNHCSY